MTADAVGGVWTYALALVRRLASSGVRTTIATMGDALRADQRAAARSIPGLALHESTFRLEWMDDPWEDVARAGAWLLDLERCERPDVVHLNGYAHAALPWRAHRVVVAHSCVCSWWRSVYGEPAPAEYDRYRREVALGLRAADAIVVPTRAMRDALWASHGQGSEAHVIPNGVEVDEFRADRKETFVLAAGRLWDSAKNLQALESAARRVRTAIFVAGDRRAPHVTPQRGPGVRALGRLSREELRGWMSRAAIYALPAKYEPFGLSVLEAALSGCALVLGDIASMREVWRDAALYVTSDDVDALVDSIERLSADAALRERMAAAARERGLSFTAERMAKEYLALYGRVTSRAPSREVERCA